MKLNQVIIAIALYFFSFNLYAIDVTRFQNACKDSLAYIDTQSTEYTNFGAGYCTGFIKAFLELTSYQNRVGLNTGFCIPNNVSTKDVIELVLDYINKKPHIKMLSEKIANEGTIVYVAMSEKYACSSPNK